RSAISSTRLRAASRSMPYSSARASARSARVMSRLHSLDVGDGEGVGVPDEQAVVGAAGDGLVLVLDPGVATLGEGGAHGVVVGQLVGVGVHVQVAEHLGGNLAQLVLVGDGQAVDVDDVDVADLVAHAVLAERVVLGGRPVAGEADRAGDGADLGAAAVILRRHSTLCTAR